MSNQTSTIHIHNGIMKYKVLYGVIYYEQIQYFHPRWYLQVQKCSLNFAPSNVTLKSATDTGNLN